MYSNFRGQAKIQCCVTNCDSVKNCVISCASESSETTYKFAEVGPALLCKSQSTRLIFDILLYTFQAQLCKTRKYNPHNTGTQFVLENL